MQRTMQFILEQQAQTRAEVRAGAASAETNDKINVPIASQIKTDEIIEAGEQRLAELSAAGEKRFAALVQSGEQADRRLDRLAESVERFINERREGVSGGEKREAS